MASTVILIVLFAIATSVVHGQVYRGNSPGSTNTAPAAAYDFDWAVNDADSGNNYGHQETRQGSDTQGSYFVRLPDGRLQRVSYTVSGDSGFVAQVTYDGKATGGYA